MEVVKVKSGDSFAIINKSDYREGEHELYEGESLSGGSDAQKRADEIELERALQANRGVTQNYNPAEGRNTSGTFSSPTPTDIRYPNKNDTEFENNHGAFIGKAAPEIRAENGLPDAPGGINPEAEAEKREEGRGAESVPTAPEEAPQRTEHNPDVAAQTVIPDDWGDKPWREQVKLAEQISGKSDMTAAQARDFLGAEAERRKA